MENRFTRICNEMFFFPKWPFQLFLKFAGHQLQLSRAIKIPRKEREREREREREKYSNEPENGENLFAINEKEKHKTQPFKYFSVSKACLLFMQTEISFTSKEQQQQPYAVADQSLLSICLQRKDHASVLYVRTSL